MTVNTIFIQSYLEKISKKFNITIDKAFEVFSIATFLDKSFDDVFNDIIIKGSDGGIDGVYIEENGSSYIMSVFQCKNTETLKQTELENFKQAVEDVFSRGNISKPQRNGLQSKFEEYKAISTSGGYIKTKQYFIFNGEINKPQTDNKRIFESYNNVQNDFEIIDIVSLDKMISRLITESKKRNEVLFNFKAEKSNLTNINEPQAIVSYSILNIKAVNIRISATSLCELYDYEVATNGTEETLFSENVRGFLGYNKTNKKIRETLDDPQQSNYFPFFNNGITMICSEMTIPSNPQVGVYNVPVKNPVIVNGLQTTRVIYDIYKKDRSKLEGVYLTIKLFETKDTQVIEKITEATNTQSTINYKDKISNKNFQKYTKEFFKNKGVLYLNKKGDVFAVNECDSNLQESISSEKILKFWFASFYEKPDVAKNSISVVLETIFDATNRDNELKYLFDGSSNSPIYSQLYLTYNILNLVTEKRKENIKNYDFIEHTDEIITYGIYKKLIEDKTFTKTDISTAYEDVVTTIKTLIDNEKMQRKRRGVEYSHNIYFKSSKSRVDYNTACDLIEEYDIDIPRKLGELHIAG